MDINYQKFHYRYCARTQAHITAPRIFNKDDWITPRDSVLHYIPQLPFGDVPSMDWYPLHDYVKGSRRPYVDHVLEMDSKWGSVRLKSGVNTEPLIRWFRAHNRRFMLYSKIQDALANALQPMVCNYGFIPMRYRYIASPYNRMFRFRNMLETVVKRIKTLQGMRKKNHFIFVDVPDTIPSRQYFMRALESLDTEGIPHDPFVGNFDTYRDETRKRTIADIFKHTRSQLEGVLISAGVDGQPYLESFDESSMGFGDVFSEGVSVEDWNRQTLGYFPDDNSMFLSEFWKFITASSDNSILKELGDDNLESVTIVFQLGGSFTCINLGWLYRQTKGSGNKSGMGDGDLYMKVLSYFNTLNESRTMVDKAYVLQTIPDEINEEEIVVLENEVDDNDEPEALPEVITQPENTDTDDEGDAIEIPTNGFTAINTQMGRLAQRDLERRKEELNKLAAKMADEADVADDKLIKDIPVAKVLTPKEEPEEVLITTDDPLEKEIERESMKLMRQGLISRAEHQRNVRLAQSWKKIPSPNGEGTLKDWAEFPPELLELKPRKVANIPGLADQSMLETTLLDYDRKYVEQVMYRETASYVMMAQKAGIAVTDFRMVRDVTAMDDMNSFRIELNPVYGKKSIWEFPLPVVNRNGKYRVNGVSYYQRKQRSDKPIRKVKRNRVQIATAYGKLFIDRSAKVVDNYGNAIVNLLSADSISENPTIKGVQYKNCFKAELPVPRLYSEIMGSFITFKLAGCDWWWDYENRNQFFSEEEIKLSRKDFVLVGRKGNEPIFMDKVGDIHDKTGKILFSFESIVPNVVPEKLPIELVTVKVKGADIPFGPFMASLMGLNELISHLGVEPIRRKKGTRRDPQYEVGYFDITFQDEVWTFKNNRDWKTLILRSFHAWRNYLKYYSVEQMNDISNYPGLMEDAGLSPRHVIEIDIIDKLLIDPGARDNLANMNEPTEPRPLLFRAAEMLEDDNYPREGDTNYILIRGYERMNHAVYRQMVQGIREFRNSPLSSKASVDINPFAVIMDIQTDSSTSISEESNPYHCMKEHANITMGGTGNRSKRAMVKSTRVFDRSDIGIRSEATVDSGDTGITQFATVNPNITSLRGEVQSVNPEGASAAQILSVTGVGAPFATYAD